MRQGAEPPSDHTGSAALLAVLEGCRNAGVERAALLVRVPELPADLRRPHHLRLIEQALEPLAGLDRASRFRLADATLVMVWRGYAEEELRATLASLSALFAGLPIAPFTLLALPRDSALLAEVIGQSLAQPVRPPPPLGQPLDPARLVALEADLAHADVALLARRRPVCAQAPGQSPRLVWDRHCLDVADLAARLAPDLDLAADPWLFRRLTRSFDRRLLAMLTLPCELRDCGPLALDLNLETVLEPEFLRFDQALPVSLRGRVGVTLPPDDGLSDPARFAFARDFLRARFYWLGLRGVTLDWLPALAAALTGFDWILLDAPLPDEAARLAPGFIPRDLAARLVLTGVETDAMRAWGQAQGITRFEGSAIRPDPIAVRRNLHRAHPILAAASAGHSRK